MNRKRVWLVVLAVAGLMVLQARDPSDDRNLIRQEICRRITVEATPVVEEAVGKVFEATFYRVKLGRKDPDGSIYGMGKLLMARKGEEMVSPSSISTDKPLPVLLALISPHFRIRDRSDAECVQQALEALYPVTSISDKNAREIRRDGDTWLLIRGKFFDHLKGFVVRTEGGKVVEMRYGLKIAK